MKHMLSAENVRDAVRHWLNDVHGVRLPKEVTVNVLYKTEEIPGCDPHDCDYVQVFNGLEVTEDVPVRTY